MKPKTREIIQSYADRLNRDVPKSEKWFRHWWERTGMKDEFDEYNALLGKRIPDVINRRFKYVIEIDGSFHEKKRIKKRDKKKDKFYRSLGYSVFRVTAYDNMSLEACVDSVLLIRSPASSAP